MTGFHPGENVPIPVANLRTDSVAVSLPESLLYEWKKPLYTLLHVVGTRSSLPLEWRCSIQGNSLSSLSSSMVLTVTVKRRTVPWQKPRHFSHLYLPTSHTNQDIFTQYYGQIFLISKSYILISFMSHSGPQCSCADVPWQWTGAALANTDTESALLCHCSWQRGFCCYTVDTCQTYNMHIKINCGDWRAWENSFAHEKLAECTEDDAHNNEFGCALHK